MRTKIPHLALALAALLFLPGRRGGLDARPALSPADRREARATFTSAPCATAGSSAATRRRQERQVLDRSTTAVPLRVISPLRTLSARAAGLTLTLRATDQLEANPEAKAAFLKAADIWMSKIGTPVTVIIDVDFGTT